jgi:hypothetical protein
VTDTDSFRLHLRGGRYNTYWVTGGFEKLQGTLADELREAVFGGASLIADGIHDDRNHLIDEALGVSYGGRVNGVSTVVIPGGLLPQGAFAFQGEPIKTELAGGEQQAGFDSANGPPAIVTNVHGAGRGVLFAFDLVATLMAQPGSALLTATLGQSIDFTLPAAPNAFTGSSEVAFTMTLANAEPVPVDLEVVVSLPGFAFTESSVPPITTAAGEVRWSLSVPAHGSVSLDWAMTAPSQAGTYDGTVTLRQSYGGTAHSLATRPIEVVVTRLEDAIPAVRAELQALVLAATAERQARDRAAAALTQAQSQVAQAQHDAAIATLIDAVAELAHIDSVSTAAQQMSIDLILREVARRWYLALPQCPAPGTCRP